MNSSRPADKPAGDPPIWKHRVHVKHGQYRGAKGWAYFAPNQSLWDTISVQLDYVQLPAPEGAAPKARKGELSFSSQSFPMRAAANATIQGAMLVRLRIRDLRVLSDLEALAELG